MKTAGIAVMGLAFHYLLEPTAARMLQKLPIKTVRADSMLKNADAPSSRIIETDGWEDMFGVLSR